MRGINKILLLAESELQSTERSISKEIENAGIRIVKRNAEAAIVVGGDGTFGFYGSRNNLPLLFVGMGSHSELGSKGVLAELHLDKIAEAAKALKEGRYLIEEYNRLGVKVGGVKKGETFTDIYVQRGVESNALRYELDIQAGEKRISEFAISDGIIVTTSIGASGYFSYPDKIVSGKMFDEKRFTVINRDEIGICHILPTYLRRESKTKRGLQPFRYTVPMYSKILIKLRREAHARLYGIGHSRKGINAPANMEIEISAERSHTKRIKLTPALKEG